MFTRQTDSDKVMRRKKCTLCNCGWYTVEAILPLGAVLHTRDREGQRGLRLTKDHSSILFQ